MPKLYFRELFWMFIEILSRLLLFRMLPTTKQILPTAIATKNLCLLFLQNLIDNDVQARKCDFPAGKFVLFTSQILK